MNTTTNRRNHFAWIGPLVALAGLLSYFFWAARFPSLRDTAWLNLLVVAAGTLMALYGVVKRRNWKSWAGLTAAAAFSGLFFWYIFGLSNQLPSSETAAAVGGPAPPIELSDHTGEVISLGDMLGRRVVVVFYRGFW